jgi:hypothetical protein
MSHRAFRIRRLVALMIVGSSLIWAAGPVHAADFWAIIANLTDAKKPHAQVDVSANIDAAPAGSHILFTVLQDGIQLSEFVVPTNARGFASSASAAPPNDNLFVLSAGAPALVRVRTPPNTTTSSAVLRQKLKQWTIVPAIPGVPATVGRVFSVTLGDVVHRATLLLANVSGLEVSIDVFVGTVGGPGTGKYVALVRDNAVGIIELDPTTDADSHLIVVSTGDIVAQLAIDEGKKNALTEVTLIAE